MNSKRILLALLALGLLLWALHGRLGVDALEAPSPERGGGSAGSRTGEPDLEGRPPPVGGSGAPAEETDRAPAGPAPSLVTWRCTAVVRDENGAPATGGLLRVANPQGAALPGQGPWRVARDGKATFDLTVARDTRVLVVYHGDDGRLSGPVVRRIVRAGTDWVWEIHLEASPVVRVHVQVVDAQGRAVADARVRAPGLRADVVLTDAEGRCEVPLIGGSDATLTARSPTDAFGSARARVGEGGQPLRIELDRQIVRVRLRLASGARSPWSGRTLSVQLFDEPGFRAVVDGPPTEREFVAPAQGFARVNDPQDDDARLLLRWPVRIAHGSRDLTLQMVECTDVVRVLVRGPGGRKEPGLCVSLRRPAQELAFESVTNASGEAEFLTVPLGAFELVPVPSIPGVAAAEVVVSGPAPRLTLRLPATTAFGGVYRGQVDARIRTRVFVEGSLIYDYAQVAHAGAAWRIECPHAGPAEVRIAATEPRGGFALIEPIVAQLADGRADIEVDEQRFASVRLELDAGDAAAYPHLAVRVGRAGKVHPMRRGTLALPLVPIGEHELFVRRSPAARWEVIPSKLLVGPDLPAMRVALPSRK